MSPPSLIPFLALALAACGAPAADDERPADSAVADDTGTPGADDTGTPPANDTAATSDDTGTDDTGEAPFAEATIDATSRTDWVYLDLDGGTVLPLDATGAAASTDWHLALRRFEVRSNGGSSGPGAGVVGLADAQDGFYDGDGAPRPAVFQAATPDGEVDHLLAAAVSPPGWFADSITPALGEDWYAYDGRTGDIGANPDVGFLVRGGEGTSHARVRVTQMDFPTRTGQGITGFTIQTEVQASGTSSFAAASSFTGSIASGGGSLCWDMDTAATVACTGTAWDLELGFVGRSFFLHTNSGDAGEGEGGALGPYAWTDLEAWTQATEDPQGNDITGDYAVDTSESLFAREGWYAYGVAGGHGLWPNHRVWLVDADGADDTSPIWAVQLTGYDGGQVTLRWRALGPGEPVAP